MQSTWNFRECIINDQEVAIVWAGTRDALDAMKNEWQLNGDLEEKYLDRLDGGNFLEHAELARDQKDMKASYYIVRTLYLKQLQEENAQVCHAFYFHTRFIQWLIHLVFIFIYPFWNLAKILTYLIYCVQPCMYVEKHCVVSREEGRVITKNLLVRGKTLLQRCIKLFLGIFLHLFLGLVSLMALGSSQMNRMQADIERLENDQSPEDMWLCQNCRNVKWPRSSLVYCQHPMFFFQKTSLILYDGLTPKDRRLLGISGQMPVFFIKAYNELIDQREKRSFLRMMKIGAKYRISKESLKKSLNYFQAYFYVRDREGLS